MKSQFVLLLFALGAFAAAQAAHYVRSPDARGGGLTAKARAADNR